MIHVHFYFIDTSGLKVTQIFPEKGNLSKILPEYLSRWTTDRMREQGIEVIPNVDVVNVSSSINGKQIQVTLSNGEKVIIYKSFLLPSKKLENCFDLSTLMNSDKLFT